jgi:soluble lytic murein transglycosylase-like protein
MKRLVLLIVLGLIAALAPAQSFQQYLALRKQWKVTAPSGAAALQTLVGSKVIEVRGVVKGSFKVGERIALMVERADGSTVIVDADAAPEWLVGNETPARLLVNAHRASESSSLRAVLIAVANEAEMARWEKEQSAIAAAAAKKSRNSRTNNGGLSGPIGRGGSRGYAPKSSKAAREWVLPASEVTPLYAAFIKKQNRRLTNSEALRIAQGIVGFSLQYNVDARLIMAMVMCESGFDPNAVSHAGAMGLGQLMPGTAQWMDVRNPYDSIENLSGTVKLVRKHLDDYKAKTGKDFESLVLSLAAYNAGAGAVKRHGGVPPYRETQNYVRKVIAVYYRLAGLN